MKKKYWAVIDTCDDFEVVVKAYRKKSVEKLLIKMNIDLDFISIDEVCTDGSEDGFVDFEINDKAVYETTFDAVFTHMSRNKMDITMTRTVAVKYGTDNSELEEGAIEIFANWASVQALTMVGVRGFVVMKDGVVLKIVEEIR